MKILIILLVLLVSAVTFLYVDANNKSDNLNGQLFGIALNGDAPNAKISVFPFPSHWDTSPIAVTETNNNSAFILPLNLSSQPLKIAVEFPGGTSGTDKQILSVVTNYQQGENLAVNITFFTHVATALAEHLVSSGVTADQAIDEANHRISKFLGIQNVVSTMANKVTAASADHASDADRFGIVLKANEQAIAEFSNKKDTLSLHDTFEFSNIIFADIAKDGVLDAREGDQSIQYNGQSIEASSYLRQISSNVLKIARSYRAKFAIEGYRKIATSLYNASDNVFSRKQPELANAG